jgi:hypothetical protein
MLHEHHIIPKHMGGSNDPSNLIELTIEEHAEAHKQLWLMYRHWQDEIAWKALSGQIGQEEVLQMVFSACGKANKGNLIPGNNKGKPWSIEMKEKFRKAKLGKKLTNSHKQKISISHMGDLNPGKIYKGRSWKKDEITGKRIWL